MKILSERELRDTFTRYSDFRFQNSALVRQYSSRGRLLRKNAMADAVTEVLSRCLPVFALVDPADVQQDASLQDLLSAWRMHHGDARSVEEAPFHLFEEAADKVSLGFLISVSLQGAWRTCIWSMDAATSILMSEREYFHVNSSRSELLNLLDERWKEISMMVTV